MRTIQSVPGMWTVHGSTITRCQSNAGMSEATSHMMRCRMKAVAAAGGRLDGFVEGRDAFAVRIGQGMAEDFCQGGDVLLGEEVFHLLGAVVDVILGVTGALGEVEFPEPVVAHHPGGFAEAVRR